jgi:hypothetical protein
MHPNGITVINRNQTKQIIHLFPVASFILGEDQSSYKCIILSASSKHRSIWLPFFQINPIITVSYFWPKSLYISQWNCIFQVPSTYFWEFSKVISPAKYKVIQIYIITRSRYITMNQVALTYNMSVSNRRKKGGL